MRMHSAEIGTPVPSIFEPGHMRSMGVLVQVFIEDDDTIRATVHDAGPIRLTPEDFREILLGAAERLTDITS
jgi:hypothetical protein